MTADNLSNDDRVDLAIVEWFEAAEQGRPIDRREFLSRYPDIVKELAAFFDDQDAFSLRAAQIATPDACPVPIPPAFRFRDYQILEEIGRGGMGIVYAAQQVSLARTVALKVLHPAVTVDQRLRQRFEREARAAAGLRHPGIVPIISVGEEDGACFYTMELVSGPSLDRVLGGLVERRRTIGQRAESELEPASAARRKLPELPEWARRPFGRDYFNVVARLVAGAAEALECAHRQGVVHRDVKPSNLLLAPDGGLRIADFGLALCGDDAKITATGELLGSPAYMSPEQAAGSKAIDSRTDIYSLGATLYELLTLECPFDGPGRDTVLQKVLHDEPRPPRQLNPLVPRDLDTICLRALEKSRAGRYPGAQELADDLRRFVDGEPVLARRVSRAERAWKLLSKRRSIVLTVTALAIALIWAAWSTNAARTSREDLAAAQLQDAVDDALIANMSGDADIAAQALARVAALEPETGWLSFLRGHLAFQRGEYDQAVGELEKAIEQLPESMAARALLAAAYVGAGWWEKYEGALDGLDESVPQSAEDHLFRGLAESYLDPARARSSLDLAIRGRRLPAAYVVRAEVSGHLALDTGDATDAEVALADARLACELLPGNPAALLERLFANDVAAGIYEGLGQQQRSDDCRAQAEHDAEALAPFSHLPSVARARAWIFVHTGREQEALEILRDSYDQSGNARVAYRYALLLYRRGAFEEALSVIERRPDRSNNEDLLRVLLLLEQPGGLERARGAYETLKAGSSNGLAALFRPIAPLLSGNLPAAAADSRDFRARPQCLPRLRQTFYERLLDYNCELISANELLSSLGRSRWDRCESHFFVGLHALAGGDRSQAREHFSQALATRCHGFLAHDWSATFLDRLDRDPNWPRWISRRE